MQSPTLNSSVWSSHSSGSLGGSSDSDEAKSDTDPVQQIVDAMYQPLMVPPILQVLKREGEVRQKIQALHAKMPTSAQPVRSATRRHQHAQKEIVAGANQRARQAGDLLHATMQTAPTGASSTVQGHFAIAVKASMPVYRRVIEAAYADATAAKERATFYGSRVGHLLQRTPWKIIASINKQHDYQKQIDKACGRVHEQVKVAEATLAKLDHFLDQIEQYATAIDERRTASELRKQATLLRLDADRYSQKAAFRLSTSKITSAFERAQPQHIDAKKDAALAELAVMHATAIAANADSMLTAASLMWNDGVGQPDSPMLRRWVYSDDEVKVDMAYVDKRKTATLQLLDAEIASFKIELGRVALLTPPAQPARKFGAPVQQLKIENDRGRRQAAMLCFEDSKAALADLGARLAAHRTALEKDQTEYPANTPAWRAINAERWACKLPGWRRAIQVHASAATAESALVALYDGRKRDIGDVRNGLQRPPIAILRADTDFAMGTPAAQALLTQSKEHIANMMTIINETDDKHGAEALLSLVTSLSNQLDSAVHAAAEYEKKGKKLQKAAGSMFAKVAWFERSRIAIESAELDRNIDSAREHFATTVENIARIRAVAEDQLVGGGEAFARDALPYNVDAGGAGVIRTTSTNGEESDLSDRSGEINLHEGQASDPSLDCQDSALTPATTPEAAIIGQPFSLFDRAVRCCLPSGNGGF